MSDLDGDDIARKAAAWVWSNRQWVAEKITGLRTWLFGKTQSEATSEILIIGPGGVGKSTAAHILAGGHDSNLDIPGEYKESIDIESYKLKDDDRVELIVPPGQRHRRDSTWGDLQASLSNGEYRGIILVGAYGYHSLGEIDHRSHFLYDGDDEKFLKDYLEDCRNDEIGVLRRLSPYISSGPQKCWLLTLITKQDLWWSDQATVEKHYRNGEYAEVLGQIVADLGPQNFRHEFVFGSLVIANFTTSLSEPLASTTAGYEQKSQVRSLRRLWETLGALKTWEEES